MTVMSDGVLRTMPAHDIAVHQRSFEADQFAHYWNRLAERAEKTSVEKGFWQDDGVVPQHYIDDYKLLRIHGEVAELSEHLRDGNPPCPKPGMEGLSGAEEEAADIIIRLMDLAHRRGWNVGEAVRRKMSVNDTRPYMHGRIHG